MQGFSRGHHGSRGRVCLRSTNGIRRFRLVATGRSCQFLQHPTNTTTSGGPVLGPIGEIRLSRGAATATRAGNRPQNFADSRLARGCQQGLGRRRRPDRDQLDVPAPSLRCPRPVATRALTPPITHLSTSLDSRSQTFVLDIPSRFRRWWLTRFWQARLLAFFAVLVPCGSGESTRQPRWFAAL